MVSRYGVVITEGVNGTFIENLSFEGLKKIFVNKKDSLQKEKFY